MTIKTLREQIAGELKADTRLAGCKVQAAYPAARRDYPIVRPVIAVGLDGLELEPSLGGFLAAGADGDRYGAPCALAVRFDIYTSDSVEGPDACELLEIVFDRLAVSDNRFGFFAFKSLRPVWDKTVEANLLTAVGRLRLALTRPVEDTAAVSAFEVRMAD